MTEDNPLLLSLMRLEKRPARKTAAMFLRAVLDTDKKCHGVGYIAHITGKSYNEVLSDSLEELQSCRRVVEADPETYKRDALKTIDHMIASTKEAQAHKVSFRDRTGNL